MPTRKNTPFNVTLLAVLLVLTLFTGSPHLHGASLTSSFTSKLTCHFFHANLFHWACNAWAMALMRPSPKQIAQAYPLAVLAMCFTSQPTIGFSAILYAHIGLRILRWNLSKEAWVTFIVANLITAPIPGVAFGVHTSAFLLSLILPLVIRRVIRSCHSPVSFRAKRRRVVEGFARKI